MKEDFPFSAVVGQEDAALALVLAAIDPSIGGVLLRGEKGAAKSTLARGLAGLLPDYAPFVELPIGATEDRVLGSLDLRAALHTGDVERFRPGLLAAAHGGVLYVDEVNLLPDHLVDALLDVAASGVHRVERDGVSHEHPARFVLLGSMNPEEGELRPQLLDRFGLSVEVRSPQDPLLRAEAVRRRLAHDAGQPVPDTDDELRQRLAAVRPAALPDSVVLYAARVAAAVGAESLRADLVLCRAARALAGWEGRSTATEDDVAQVAPLALGHRRRRRPFDPPILPADELDAALSQADMGLSEPEVEYSDYDDVDDFEGDEAADDDGTRAELPDDAAVDPLVDDEDELDAADGEYDEGELPDATDPLDRADPGEPEGLRGPYDDVDTQELDLDPDSLPPPPAVAPPLPGSVNPPPRGGRPGGPGGPGGPGVAPEQRWQDLAGDSLTAPSAPLDVTAPAPAPRVRPPAPEGPGPVVGHRVPDGDGPEELAVLPTVRAAVQRRAQDPSGPMLAEEDLREPRRIRPVGRVIVIAVDTSGSMGTTERVSAATGAVMGLLADAYLRRDKVALVAFRDAEAIEVLPATASVELARARLASLDTGGPTPLAEGITTALSTAQRAAQEGGTPLLVVLTDGRPTGSPGALDRALQAAEVVRAAGVEAVVFDAEDDRDRLGLAAKLAEAMGGRTVHLSSISAAEVEIAIRKSLTG